MVTSVCRRRTVTVPCAVWVLDACRRINVRKAKWAHAAAVMWIAPVATARGASVKKRGRERVVDEIRIA